MDTTTQENSFSFSNALYELTATFIRKPVNSFYDLPITILDIATCDTPKKSLFVYLNKKDAWDECYDVQNINNVACAKLTEFVFNTNKTEFVSVNGFVMHSHSLIYTPEGFPEIVPETNFSKFVFAHLSAVLHSILGKNNNPFQFRYHGNSYILSEKGGNLIENIVFSNTPYKNIHFAYTNGKLSVLQNAVRDFNRLNSNYDNVFQFEKDDACAVILIIENFHLLYLTPDEVSNVVGSFNEYVTASNLVNNLNSYSRDCLQSALLFTNEQMLNKVK